MNLDRIFANVAEPLLACLRDGLCTQKAATQILTLLIAELKSQGWHSISSMESLRAYAKYGWAVDAFRANEIFPLAVPGSITTLPFKDMLFAVNMLTGEVDVTVNGGDLNIMKLSAVEFQDLMQSGLATLELVAPKPQALATVGACGGGCSS